MINICFFSMALSVLAQPLPAAIPTGSPIENLAADEQSMETTYYILHDGVYKEVVLSQVPEFNGGDDAMELLLQLNIRYPDAAREQKIGGTVRVSVVINEEGQMEDAFIHEGIGGGCNDEALRAVKLLDTTGFEPGRLKGKAVTVKFDIPITFRPE
jgi:TonB family protein